MRKSAVAVTVAAALVGSSAMADGVVPRWKSAAKSMPTDHDGAGIRAVLPQAGELSCGDDSKSSWVGLKVAEGVFVVYDPGKGQDIPVLGERAPTRGKPKIVFNSSFD